jgi:lipopolysaccharide transport system permease protein
MPSGEHISRLEEAEKPLEKISSALRKTDGNLAQRPVISIRSGQRWRALNLAALWAHRDLLYFLIWRDVKVRYKQTVLGVAWAVLQPLLTMVVFTVLFGRLAHVPSDGRPYPIFVYAGLVPWNFFAAAVDASSNSLIGNSALITKVYFPRLIIPAAAVGAALVDFGIASAILFIMCFYYGIGVHLSLLILIPLALLTASFAVAVGLRLAALNVKYRDIRHTLPFIMNIWMYLTPVIYPLKFIPSGWRWVLMLNPLGGIIQGFRSAVFNQRLNPNEVTLSFAIVVAALMYSLYSFQTLEREFADLI